MFITGQTSVSTNQPTSTFQLPWKLDGTYDLMLPNIVLSIRSGRKQSDGWIEHIQIKSMLYILKHFHKEMTNCPFELSSHSYTTEDVEYLKNENITPDYMGNNGYYSYRKGKQPGFRVIEIQKNSQRLFPYLDTLKKDEKPISMALQESVNHRVRVYKYNQNDQEYYTIVCNMWTWDMARKLIALFPKLYTGFEVPEEVEPIFALFGTNKFDEWCSAYNTWVQSLHLLDEIKKAKLSKLINLNKDRQISNIESTIEDLNAKIDNYLADVASKCKTRQQYQQQLIGLRNMQELDVDDFFTYLQKNKSIERYIVEDNTLTLIIRTAWNYYDEAMFAAIINNPRAKINEYSALSRLFKKIYTPTPRFELWTDTAVNIDFVNYKFSKSDAGHCKLFPQTHIHNYNCWGGNAALIQKSLGNRDYITMIEQMIAAAKNINWADGIVTGHVFDNLTGSYRNLKTIEDLKTGEFISYIEAVQILDMEEKQNEMDKDNTRTAAVNA
jgi:hypothetical protein